VENLRAVIASQDSIRDTDIYLYNLNEFLCDVNGYRSITMFMIDEYSIENLLFLTQWTQLKELIRISGVVTFHNITDELEPNEFDLDDQKAEAEEKTICLRIADM
jgi:hypothetical protein